MENVARGAHGHKTRAPLLSPGLKHMQVPVFGVWFAFLAKVSESPTSGLIARHRSPVSLAVALCLLGLFSSVQARRRSRVQQGAGSWRALRQPTMFNVVRVVCRPMGTGTTRGVREVCPQSRSNLRTALLSVPSRTCCGCCVARPGVLRTSCTQLTSWPSRSRCRRW